MVVLPAAPPPSALLLLPALPPLALLLIPPPLIEPLLIEPLLLLAWRCFLCLVVAVPLSAVELESVLEPAVALGLALLP